MKGFKFFIDKESIIDKIPEQYQSKEIAFVQVNNNINSIELTAVILTDDEDSILSDLNHVVREKLNFNNNK